MKILILHNAYQQRGGEDTVVEQEAALLRAAGHEVHVEILTNDGIVGPLAKLRALASVRGNRASARHVAHLVAETGAQVVHVHNFFPLLSPAAHLAASEAGAAVVQTLHNYRLLCAGAMFLREGRICEECLGTRGLPALRHRCYRKSLPGTAAVLATQGATAGSRRWLTAVDRLIALTEFGRKKFIEGGLPAEKLVVKPNFAAGLPAGPAMAERPNAALFVGRLSEEKGLRDLIKAWHTLPDVPLKVVGGGPLEGWVRANAPANVEVVGLLPREEVLAQMRQARLLAFPSRWYEGFPMTLAEAMASGTPIVAADVGAVGEIIGDGAFGRLHRVGDIAELAATVRDSLAGDLQAQSKTARQRYLERYDAPTNLAMLEWIYEDAIAVRTRRSQRL